MQLRLDRKELPSLPRPAWEIGAEILPDQDLRIWVQGDRETLTRIFELKPPAGSDVEAAIAGMLLECGEFAGDAEVWATSIAQASTRIARWYRGAKRAQ